MLVRDSTGGWVVVLRPIRLEFGFQLDSLLIYVCMYVYMYVCIFGNRYTQFPVAQNSAWARFSVT